MHDRHSTEISQGYALTHEGVWVTRHNLNAMLRLIEDLVKAEPSTDLNAAIEFYDAQKRAKAILRDLRA